MLDKLLRAPLPEQIVALLEKLEQNPDTSHLQKVTNLLGYYDTELTKYEEWVIKRQMRKIHNVIRRAQTLDDVMNIVVDRPTREEQAKEARIAYASSPYTANLAKSMQATKNAVTSGVLMQSAAAQQAQIDHLKAHQQMMNQAQAYGIAVKSASGFLDPSNVYTSGSSQ
jgi:hypothetical protein